MSVMAFVKQENQKQGGTVLPALDPHREGPLQPFEERQLKNLIQQVAAAPERVRKAFYASIKHLD